MKSRLNKLKINLLLIFTVGTLSNLIGENSPGKHEITIYVIPSVSEIDWSNPSTLFKSMEKCYVKALFQKNYYVIGHTIARIESTSLQTPKYIAMSGLIQTEKVKLVIKDKVGFGVMGSTIQGHLESEKSIKKGIKLYSKYHKVAFIKFSINEQSLKRMLEFVKYYQTKNEFGFAPCEKYNGALWPGYKNEGSGCSAFGMSLLQVGGILPEDTEDWFVDVKVPMEIIGGRFNQNKKIKFKTMFNTTSWYKGNGKENVDYVNYKVYDPQLIFNWILRKNYEKDCTYQPIEENGVLGVYINRSDVHVAEDEPLFKQRTDSSLFQIHYYNYINCLKNTSTAVR